MGFFSAHHSLEVASWGPQLPSSRSPKLLDRVSITCRRRHFSPRTEQSYRYWIRKFILFHGKRHPSAMGKSEVESFLNHLAVQARGAASTQSQALNAIVFLYESVLYRPLGEMAGLTRVQRPKRVPVVLTPKEVQSIFDLMKGTPRLMAELIYGAGLRVNECVTLRVKDIDTGAKTVSVRAGKGTKDRTSVLPDRLLPSLTQHLLRVTSLHKHDCLHGSGYAPMPNALHRKYPNASRSLGWQ